MFADGIGQLPWMADALDSHNSEPLDTEERRGFPTTLAKFSVLQSSIFLIPQVLCSEVLNLMWQRASCFPSIQSQELKREEYRRWKELRPWNSRTSS